MHARTSCNMILDICGVPGIIMISICLPIRLHESPYFVKIFQSASVESDCEMKSHAHILQGGFHWGLPLCFWVSDLNSSLHVGGEV